MITLQDYSRITSSMFSAALGTSTWNDFLLDLSVHADGVRTHLFGYDTEAKISLEPILNDYDPAYIESYNNYYGQINSWAPGFAKKQVGVAIDSDAMCPMEDLVKTEFYNDWVKPQDDIVQGGGALLFKNDTRIFAIGGNIPLHHAEDKKHDWLRLVDLLVPQLQHAFEISRALAGAKLESALIAHEGLRSVPAIVLLSGTGRIVYANATAQNMIDKGNVISHGVLGTLSYRNGPRRQTVDAHFLRHRLNAANPSLTVSASDPLERGRYQLRLARLTNHAQAVLTLDPVLGLSEQCTILLINKHEDHADAHKGLQKHYGLTEAEAAVAVMVGNGKSSSEIAEERAVSIFTVRNQVKSILVKTGKRRQAELVRLVSEHRQPHSLFGS